MPTDDEMITEMYQTIVVESLYSELKALNVPMDNHESDLYVLDIPEVREILNKYPLEKRNMTTFVNQSEPHRGKRWLDIPFAYLPFWEERQKRLR